MAGDDHEEFEKLDEETPRLWPLLNGERQQAFNWSSAAFLLALLTAFGGLTAYVANLQSSLRADIAENRRAAADLEHQLEKYESSDQVWKDEEHRYDAEVRGVIKENEIATRESLRHINDRVNAIAIAKGIVVPP